MQYEDNYREAKVGESFAIAVLGGGFIRCTAYALSGEWLHCDGKFDGTEAVQGWFDIPVSSIRFIKTERTGI